MIDRMIIQVKSGTVENRIKKIENNIINGSPELVLVVVDKGYNYARNFGVPKDTRSMMKAVQKRVWKHRGRIIFSQPDHPRSGREIPYHIGIDEGRGDYYFVNGRLYKLRAANSGKTQFRKHTVEVLVRQQADIGKRWIKAILVK